MPFLTPEKHDKAFPRRLAIALGISLIINALIFGSAGLAGHYFLQSLRPKPKPVEIRRIVLPARVLDAAGGIRPTSPAPSRP